MARWASLAFALIVLATPLEAVGAKGPSKAEKKAHFEATIPVCFGQEDCQAKWEAAQLWVIHNAGYKIQTVTDVLIQTFSPGPYDARNAARVTKEPLGGGKYRIVVYLWCNNVFGCIPNGWDSAINFNLLVGATAPPSAAVPRPPESGVPGRLGSQKWTISYRDSVVRYLLLYPGAEKSPEALRSYAAEACGDSADCEAWFWDRAAVAPTSRIRSGESKAAAVGSLKRVQGGDFEPISTAGVRVVSEVAQTPEANACYKLVFNRFCLGGPLSAEEKANLTQEIGPGVQSYAFGEPQDLTLVVVVDGVIGSVIRGYSDPSWLRYSEVVGKIEEANGPGQDGSIFPGYADDFDARATSISLGKGTANRSWKFQGWNIFLVWHKDRMTLSYRVDALMPRMAPKEGY